MTNNEHPAIITVCFAMRGFFCSEMHWNNDFGGFYEPYQSDWMSFETGDTANERAKTLAASENLVYKPRLVGATLQSEAERSRIFSQYLQKKIARIKELKETGMSGRDAIDQTNKEIPRP